MRKISDEIILKEFERILKSFKKASDMTNGHGYYYRLDKEVSFGLNLVDCLLESCENDASEELELFIRAMSIVLPHLYDEQIIHGDYFKEGVI
jgi:hypothetical protein